jgi:hypothetical protein
MQMQWEAVMRSLLHLTQLVMDTSTINQLQLALSRALGILAMGQLVQALGDIVHQYIASGTYTACLTILDAANSCTDTLLHNNHNRARQWRFLQCVLFSINKWFCCIIHRFI